MRTLCINTIATMDTGTSGTVPCGVAPPVPRQDGPRFPAAAVARPCVGARTTATPPHLPLPAVSVAPYQATMRCPALSMPPRGAGHVLGRVPGDAIRGTSGRAGVKVTDPCGSAPQDPSLGRRPHKIRVSHPGCARRPRRLTVNLRACEVAARRRNTLSALELGRVLGQGSGGRVHLAVERNAGGRCYAVKIGVTPEARAAVRNELEMLVHRVAPHQNIVRVPHHLVPPPREWEAGNAYVPLEFARDGDLLGMVEAGHAYGPCAVAEIGRQLAAALRHCHKAGVYHRDVKPENVLVFRDEGYVRLTDFGSATTDARPLDCSTTRCYAAPEVLRCDRHRSAAVLCGAEASASGRAARGYDAAAADVWSLGISLFAMLVGRYPWQLASSDNVFYNRYVTSGLFDPQVLACMPAHDESKATRGLLRLLQRMLSVAPESRPTMAELVSELAALAGAPRAARQAPAHTGAAAVCPAGESRLHAGVAVSSAENTAAAAAAATAAATVAAAASLGVAGDAPSDAAEGTADSPMHAASDFGITPVARSVSAVSGTCVETMGDGDVDLGGDTSDDDVPMSTSCVEPTSLSL